MFLFNSRSSGKVTDIAVSYTHLDVYKRQERERERERDRDRMSVSVRSDVCVKQTKEVTSSTVDRFVCIEVENIYQAQVKIKPGIIDRRPEGFCWVTPTICTKCGPQTGCLTLPVPKSYHTVLQNK